MEKPFGILKYTAPFHLLPDNILENLSGLLQESKFNRDTVVYRQEISSLKGVDIIAEGEYESFFYDSAENKRLTEHHRPGSCYGGISVLLNRNKSLHTVIAKKGTVVYSLPRKEFRALCQDYPDFCRFFAERFVSRMLNDEYAHFYKRPVSFEENYISADSVYSRKIENAEFRPIVSVRADASISEAARVMAREQVSCIFITDPSGQYVGQITDMLLRDQVVATGLEVHLPAERVMSREVITIDAQSYVYEALLLMLRHQNRYLLVKKDGNYIGFLSRNRLLAEQAQSPLVFIQSVRSALSTADLTKKWEQVPAMVTQLLGRGVHAEIVNQVITTISDTIALRVIEHVIGIMGPPPARFAFMVLGSEGRKEQTLKTDQDNAIIYEDKANEHREEVRAYFLKFAETVSEKLNEIGFYFCTGGFMASNPKWTHSLSHWKNNYREWMEASVPETVMKFSTFFDCRFLYGDASIITDLQAFLNEELQKPMESFYFHMAKNALQYEPPLTFFKSIRTTTRGQEEVFDIKRAMTPIVDLVRVYALSHRIFEVNTGERLKALKDKGVFSETEFQELMQSYYLLMRLRLNKQARQIIHDKTAPDNFVNIRSLTKIERVTLTEIFKTIENFQSRIKVQFTNNLFG